MKRRSATMERIRSVLITLRDMMTTAGPLLVLAIAGVWAAYVLINPTPPKKVVMATGPEGGDYQAIGKRYQHWLAHNGIELELRVTEGARQNLELLIDPDSGVDVALLRSGVGSHEEETQHQLESIGSLFYEPLWILHRDRVKLASPADLRGLKVDIGLPGSGASRLIEQMLIQNGLQLSDLQTSSSGAGEAAERLLAGKVDAIALISASDSEIIQKLLHAPGIRLLNFRQAEAYTRRLPSLTRVVLPRGVVDLAADVPAENMQLVAPTAMLVARDNLHPALLQLFVQAAKRAHGQPDWFSRTGDFPRMVATSFPMSDEAQRLYQQGTPFLQHYLPFWMSNLISRMWLVLLSLAAMLIPLGKILPPIYQWRVRSRIYRWYAQLREIEADAIASTQGQQVDRAALSVRLDALEDHVNHITVPLSYADEVYFLKQHIHMIRQMVQAPLSSSAPQAESRADSHADSQGGPQAASNPT